MKNRKITTGFIIVGLLLSALTLLTTAAVANEETRAGSVSNVGFQILECSVVNDKYGLGFWQVNVTFEVAGEAVNNARIKVEITSQNSEDQDNETPGGTYLPGNNDVVCNLFNFTIEDQYTIVATVSYDGGGPATYQEVLTFEEVVEYTINNITLYRAPSNGAGEYGILHSKGHIINADIANKGNHKCNDISSRENQRQLDKGLVINVTVKTGGVNEIVLPGELVIENFQSPEPNEMTSFVEKGLKFEWRPSKEATFIIEIKVTDACTSTAKTSSANVVIKNAIHLTMEEVKTDPVDTVLQGQNFDIIVDLNTSGSNCDPMIEVGFEIKDGANNLIFKNNLTQRLEPMGGGDGGGGTSGASAIMAIYFSDVSINEHGTFTITATVTDPALTKSTSLEVTQIANDAPVIEDKTVRDSMTSLRKDDTVYFKLKFTDTLYAANVKCWVSLDEGDMEMTCLTEEHLRNYTQGEIFQYDWSATGGENNYTMKVTDGILNVSTQVYNFFVLDVPPGYGMVKGHVKNGTSGDPIAGANVKIENKANGNTTEVVTNATGYYQQILVFGVYKIQVDKDGYNTSSTEFQIKDSKDVENKDFMMSPEGEGPIVFGYLKGYIKTLVNGSEQLIGGANIELASGGVSHWGDSENGTGEYLIKPKSIGVPVGDYTITITKKGYKDIDESIAIKVGENTQSYFLELKIDEGPGIADNFTLKLTVNPYDAEVHVDGVSRVGQDIPPGSGLYFFDLARGPHKVEVFKTGFITYLNDEIDLLSDHKIDVILEEKAGGDDEDVEPPVSEDSIKLKDSNGNPVVGATIEFKIGNITYTATTNSEGIAEFNVTVPKVTQVTITTKSGEVREGTIGDNNIYTWVVETKDPEASDEKISMTLIYIIIGVVALVIIFIVCFLIIKKKGSKDDDYDDDDEDEEEEDYEEEKPLGPSMPAVTTVSMGSCSKCGTVVPQGTTFCPQCGNNMKAPPPASLACRGCGTQVQKGVTFCPNCGMSMTQGQLPVAGMQPVVPQLPQQTMGGGGGFGPQSSGGPPVQQQQTARLPPGPAQSSGPSLDDLMASATVGDGEPPLPPPP
jgi:RNA polymerase subunit RPABC4/transcription elongation factor Spt4